MQSTSAGCIWLTEADSAELLSSQRPLQTICLQPAGSDAVDIWAVYMPHDIAQSRQVCQVRTSNAAGHSNLIIGTQQIWQQIDAADKLQRIADEEHAQLLQALQMKPTDDTG